MSYREPITSLEDPIDEPEEDPQRPRLTFFRVVVVLGFTMLLIQLWRLQIVEGQQYRVRADNNRFRLMAIEAPRGVVYDRNHILLVRNRPSYTIGITPADLPADPLPVYRRLAVALSMDAAEIQDRVKSSKGDRFTLIPLKSNVAENLALVVEERHRELPGVHVVVQPIREYLDGPLTSHILGYVGPITGDQYELLKNDPDRQYHLNDRVGQVGAELRFEAELRGRPGQRRMEVDAAGREVRTLGVTSPQPGRNLVLTIDLDLQSTVMDLLSARSGEFETASVVAIDPSNGQVLSLVHLPTYDNNMFSRGITGSELRALIEHPNKPLLNGSIGATYAPGEIFKPITAAGALQEGVVKPDTKVDCSGQLIVPNRFDPTLGTRFRDTGVYGQQDLVGSFANGCRIYFYLAAGGDPEGKSEGLGIDRLIRYAQLFGLGKAAGVDLAGEADGFLPTAEWKRTSHDEVWYKGDTYLVAIGQNNVLATPLQMAVAFATIANGGTLYRPQILLEEMDDRGTVIQGFRPDVLNTVPIQSDFIKLVRRGLQAAADRMRTRPGLTAGQSGAGGLGELTIAAQAATVDSGRVDARGEPVTHGWYAAFAPVENPRIAVVVFLRHGRGVEDAAPIGDAIIRQYLLTPGGAN